jgi:tetratricopeptide (TPR) repeat protein
MLGSKTISAGYNKLTNWVSKILALPKLLSELYRKIIADGKKHMDLMLINLKDLRTSNLRLGIIHLKLGNINDAIMRLKMVTKFFGPKDATAHYYLGWAYFIKDNYTKAQENLKLGQKEDKENLASFIQNIDSVKEVPSEIWLKYRELTAKRECDKWQVCNNQMPKEFIAKLFDELGELPKDCQILDLGAGDGAIGRVIDNKLHKNYRLTGTQDLEDLQIKIRHLEEDGKQIYDDLISDSVAVFLKNNKASYHIIISFDSLGFTSNLQPYFNQIHKLTKQDGFLALLLRSSDKTTWDQKIGAFIYSSQDVVDQLKLADFNIVNISEWTVSRSNDYKMFICRK